MRLERHMERKAWIASFGRPKMTPQSLKASVTGVSPYLRFGALSPRLFYRDLAYLYRKVSATAARRRAVCVRAQSDGPPPPRLELMPPSSSPRRTAAY